MRIVWDISEKIPELRKASMPRLIRAGEIIRDAAKQILAGQIRGPRSMQETASYEHGPYKKGKYGGQFWTERSIGAMVKTIRVTTKKEDSGFGASVGRNVWIIAGNKKPWWAYQMEFGRGGWKGGRKSFLRPAINKSIPAIKSMLENG